VDINAICQLLGLSVDDVGTRSLKLRRHKSWPHSALEYQLKGLSRASLDRTRKEKSVGDQEEAGYLATLDVYGQGRGSYDWVTENDQSASGIEKRVRPEFDKFYAAVATPGEVDIVVVWAISRITRNHHLGLDFMWVCYVNDVRIFVVEDYLNLVDQDADADGHRAAYNMRVDTDWNHVAEEFRKADDFSRKHGGLVKRGKAGSRRAGKLTGQAAGGWVRRYSPEDGKPLAAEVVLAQAAVLVREVRELAAGTSPTMVAHKLNADDVPPFTPKRRPREDGTVPSGNRFGKWSAQAVVVTALNPAHIGMISKKKLGPDKRRDLSDDSLMPASHYFPIVRGPAIGGAGWAEDERKILGWHGTEDEWIALWKLARDNYLLRKSGAAELARHKRTDGTDGKPYVNNLGNVRPGGSKHMQSYISTCEVCGGPLRVICYDSAGRKLWYLTCEKSGHVSIREDWADEYVSELVAAKLSSLILHGGYKAEDRGRLSALVEKRAQRAEFHNGLITRYMRRGKSDKDAQKVEDAENERDEELAGLDELILSAKIPTLLQGYWDTGGDPALIAARWAGKDQSARRAELKILARITVSRRPLSAGQALRLPDEQRRQVARSQVHVVWAEEYRQDSDAVTAADGGERIRAIPEDPDPATWGIPAEGKKWCGGECKQLLPADLEHFYKAPDTERTRPTADGLMNVCKTCHRARVRRRKAERKARQAGVVPVEKERA
jgi:DNA invertase Pin-like site-specific DNA recombinase